MSGYPTTRRHPRSMAQAFPREHACAIERYRGPSRFSRQLGVALAIAIGLALAAVLFFNL